MKVFDVQGWKWVEVRESEVIVVAAIVSPGSVVSFPSWVRAAAADAKAF